MARKADPAKVKDASELESVAPKPVPVSVEDLYLDPKNPRLAEDGFGIEDQVQILKVLWKERAVNEIVNSIAASGYWPQEVLFAAREEGKLVVVEGNRRLSAVKLLLSRDLQKEVGATGVPIIGKSTEGESATPSCRRVHQGAALGVRGIQARQWSAGLGFHCQGRVHCPCPQGLWPEPRENR